MTLFKHLLNFKMMKSIIKNMRPALLFSGLATILFASCNIDDGDNPVFSELGAVQTEYTVPSTAGELKIPVYTNQSCNISMAEPTQWASLMTTSIVGDSTITLQYNENTGFPRKTKVAVYAPKVSRADTVVVKQEGTVPYIKFAATNKVVLGTGEDISDTLDTNIPPTDIKVEITYLDGSEGGWLTNYSIADGKFKITAQPNPSESSIRNAKITLSYVDDWGDIIKSELYLLQKTSLNKLGSAVGFDEVRDMLGKVTKDVYITGYVVSDTGNPNVADTPNTTTTAIDYGANDKTVYIESLDGKYGFKIKTATASDNIFYRYAKVELLLKGTTISMDTNPNCYTISGVTNTMLVTSTAGTASDLPKKEKTINELTDDDIYTYVTLKNCEFPVRKGPMTPVNEGYTALFAVNRVAKYPLLFRDINGDSMYMLTNMKCNYRRDGSTLPYGSGTISGVIVHETYARFNYMDTSDEDTYGQIGRYQIRHMSKDDINISSDFSSGFSELLTEFQWANIDNGVLKPTYGTNGELYCTCTAAISPYQDWTYLGPCGASSKGNKNGNGVILSNGSKLSTNKSTNGTGKGEVNSADKSAWGVSDLWWNSTSNRGEAWVLKFSTAGISKSLSMQIAVLNNNPTCPRYWNVEWSTTGNMDGTWSTISSYAVPDVIQWSGSRLYQLNGFKYININLPDALLGKQTVYIRLIPSKNLASDGNGYANAEVSKGSTVMDYLSIRYNK
jgi:hypothetical protein